MFFRTKSGSDQSISTGEPTSLDMLEVLLRRFLKGFGKEDVETQFLKMTPRLIQLADINFLIQMPAWTQIIAFNKMNMSLTKQKNTMKT